MKLVKGISLFVVYPLFLLVLGFYGGVKATRYFDSGTNVDLTQTEQIAAPQETPGALGQDESGKLGESGEAGIKNREGDAGEDSGILESGEKAEIEEPVIIQDDSFDYGVVWEDEQDAFEAASSMETLCVDTKYVLEETDVLTGSVVETTWSLPARYVGMNREQFLEAMEIYESFPPLVEMERGFVSLEVRSFSRERVVVQMNYKFVQPSSSFYLAVYDNKVVVLLEDKETVYIETNISLDTLPGELQRDIMKMMWIEDQEKLYDFLENYSS